MKRREVVFIPSRLHNVSWQRTTSLVVVYDVRPPPPHTQHIALMQLSDCDCMATRLTKDMRRCDTRRRGVTSTRVWRHIDTSIKSRERRIETVPTSLVTRTFCSRLHLYSMPFLFLSEFLLSTVSFVTNHTMSTPFDHGSSPLNMCGGHVFTCTQSPLSTFTFVEYGIPSLNGSRASLFSASFPRHPYGSR